VVNKYRNVQFCIKMTQHTEIFMFNYIMKVLEKEVWNVEFIDCVFNNSLLKTPRYAIRHNISYWFRGNFFSWKSTIKQSRNNQIKPFQKQ